VPAPWLGANDDGPKPELRGWIIKGGDERHLSCIQGKSACVLPAI
jgi:hypothetical protein